jgi:transcriptional regulator with XRE-family HTH domain
MLGERITRLRKLKGLSQYALAERLGFSRGKIANYEQGSRQPDYDTLRIIADFFDVSIDYLLSGDSEKKKDHLPDLTSKDEKDIAKKLENILESMESGTALSFDGEPMDDETKELVRMAIENNLKLTKQLAKKKFTPKIFRNDQE